MANITKLYLLSVPLEKDYDHTLFFYDKTSQYNYFYGKRKKSYADFSYQRKDKVIRIPEHIDDLYAAGVNYVMYQNSAYSDRWFYAFITGMEYRNDEKTDVYIETDCIQTWMFDITIHESFVEREHAATDDLGEYTLEEGLETGDYVVNSDKALSIGAGDAIIAAVTQLPDGTKAPGSVYHGMYSGLCYIPFSTDGDKLAEFIKSYDEDAAADAISMMFLAPKVLLLDDEGLYVPGQPLGSREEPYKLIINKPTSTWGSFDLEVGPTDFSDGKIDGYTPRNKKLLCYPYRYLLASNNAGGSAMYRFEKFYREGTTTDGYSYKTIIAPSFVLAGCLTPGCSIRLIPQCYNGADENHEEGLNMGKYPTLNWTSDAFTNWLTQNGANIAINLASGVGQVVAGAAVAVGTGGLGAAVGSGSIVGGISSIAGTLGQIYQQSLVPPQARGNTNGGDVITAMGDNEFKFYTMTIKAEYAAIIDDYFDMFGYKCHRVKVPESDHRASFWYTKTLGANITGAIPQADLQVIKDCYNKGITFWRATANFRDYSVNNGMTNN